MQVKEYFNNCALSTASNVQSYLCLYGGYIVKTTAGTYLTEIEAIKMCSVPELMILNNCLSLDSCKIIDQVTLNGNYIVSIERHDKQEFIDEHRTEEDRKCITCLFHFSNLKYVPDPVPEFMRCSKPNGNRRYCLRNGYCDWQRAGD
jgi:hypothetical protein